MGPQKQLIPISFAGGIDTKTDPKQVVPGKLLDLQNGVFQQTGAINRRWGYRALGRAILGSSSSIAAAFAIQAFNNELLLYDGLSAYSYSPAADAWAARGSIVSVVQTNQQVIANSSQQLSPDFAILNGVELYAWEDSRGGIRYTARDANTGTILTADNPLFVGMPTTIIRPRVLAWQGLFYVLFANGTNLGFVTINPANPGAVPSAAGTLLGTRISPIFFDAVTTTLNGSQLAVLSLFNNVSNGTQDWTLTLFTGSLSIALSITIIQSATPFPAVSPSLTVDTNGNYWCGFVGPTTDNVQYAGINPNNPGASYRLFAGTVSVIASLGTVASIAGLAFPQHLFGTTGVGLQVFAEIVGSQPYNQLLRTNAVYDSGAVRAPFAAASVFARSVGLASKPFLYGNTGYINVAFQSAQQSTNFLLAASFGVANINNPPSVVGKVFAGLCGGLVANSDFMLPQCQQVATGIFKYANLVRGTVNTVAGQVVALLGVNATKLDFADTNHFLSESLNGDLYTIGGILQAYDGAQYVEHGFHVAPELAAGNFVPSAAGGSMATGTYNYCFTYEWVNNNNQNDISAPSVAVAVAVTGPTGSVQVTIPTLRLTNKSKVKIVGYRTTVTPVAGTILYRVTSALVPLYNDPTVDSVVFTDTLADASITSNGAMYTQPLNVNQGNPVLPNSAPPSCSLIATFDDRIIISGLDDPYSWWPSQQAIPGAPAQFSAALAQRLDPDGGPITALVRMDDKLVFFKSNAIFYIAGQGPTATGDASQFTSPAIIPSGEVGCISPNTTVLTPIGIMFQSANGIYLLDRALNVTYKGAPVEKYTSPNQLGLTITSASLIPNQWVIFTTTQGTALVYDYFYDQWSTFTNHAAIDSDLYFGQGDVLAWASPGGQVFLQTPTTFTDAGQPIPFLLTMLLQFAGLQGYQRLYHLFLLGQYKGSGNGSHILNVAGAFDFDDPFTTFATIPIDSTLGLSTFGSASPFGSDSPFGGFPGQTVFQFRLDVLRKCQVMRLQITDSQAAPGDEAFSLSALSALVGVKKGGFKMPAIKQFGVS